MDVSALVANVARAAREYVSDVNIVTSPGWDAVIENIKTLKLPVEKMGDLYEQVWFHCISLHLLVCCVRVCQLLPH